MRRLRTPNKKKSPTVAQRQELLKHAMGIVAERTLGMCTVGQGGPGSAAWVACAPPFRFRFPVPVPIPVPVAYERRSLACCACRVGFYRVFLEGSLYQRRYLACCSCRVGFYRIVGLDWGLGDLRKSPNHIILGDFNLTHAGVKACCQRIEGEPTPGDWQPAAATKGLGGDVLVYKGFEGVLFDICLLYTSPSPRD